MDLQEKLLKTGAGLVILFGGVIWMGAHPAMAAVPTFFGDLIFWPLDGAQRLTSEGARLLSAIGGGIMVGWGILLWALAGEGMRIAPAFSKRVILLSIWTWFCVDSLGSVLAGAPFNLIGNLVFLGMFTIPFLDRFASKGASTAKAS